MLALAIGSAIAGGPALDTPEPAGASASAATSRAPRAADEPAMRHCDQESAPVDGGDDAQTEVGKDAPEGVRAANAQTGDTDDESADSLSGEDTGCSDADHSSADNQSNDGDGDSQDAENDNQDNSTLPPGPTTTSGIDYYSDSENNVVWSDRTVATVPLDDYLLGYRKDAVQARDADGYQRLAATSFSIHRDLTEQFGLSGGFGSVQSLVWSDPVGSLESEVQLLGASVTARISRDMLSATAQEIRANIRQTDFSMSLSKDLNKRLTVDVELHHTMYSDGNRSDDVEFAPQYTIELHKSKLSFGYNFQYLAFANNPNNGYWAPRELISHQGTVKWAYDWSAFFGSLNFSAGDQIVGQFGGAAKSAVSAYGGASGFDASITGKLGMRLGSGCSMQYYLNRDASVGFSSTATGLMINYAF